MKAKATTPIQAAIASFEEKSLTRFKPDSRFYAAVGINQFRFWKIVRGEVEMTLREAITLGSHFAVEPTTLLPQQMADAV